MIEGLWRSQTHEGSVPVREVFCDERGLAITYNMGNWLTYQGRRVYQGEHAAVNHDMFIRDMRDLVRRTNNEPTSRRMKVLVDCHT